MKNGKRPDPDKVHPINGYDKEIYIKPTINNPNIIVGDFSYIADSDFESHVTHHYEWNGDKLIIGKFCQIAAGVEFVMNGANHQMNAVSTFPFYTLEGWNMEPPAMADLPLKGDTVIENDVWIGQNAVILPGVHIGDGAIIGANSVVGKNVEPYTIVHAALHRTMELFRASLWNSIFTGGIFMSKTIRELTELNGRVYVYLADETTGRQFLEQAEQEGFTFGDGVKPTQRHWSDLMAVNHDGTINYVGTNGRIAWSSGAKTVGGETLIRVDYRKYRAQDEI